MERALIGSWSEDWGHLGASINQFTEDHLYYGEFQAPSGGDTVSIEGTWAVHEDVLLYTVTSSSDPNYPYLGKTIRDKIESIDQELFNYVSLEFGATCQMKRIESAEASDASSGPVAD